MKVTLELWQLITLAVMVSGMFVGLGKLLLMQFERRMDDRFGTLNAESKGWRDLERDYLTFRAELPEKYVQRADYIRGQSVIEAKLDAMFSELKVVQIQGAKRAN